MRINEKKVIRYYKGVNIHYDKVGELKAGYNEVQHWFINRYCTIENGKCQVIKIWFSSLAGAKKFINEY